MQPELVATAPLQPGDRYHDGGPIYCETNLIPDVYFREPINALTTFILLFVAGYWLWKLRGNYREFSFIIANMILVLIAFIGNFIYHGFRLHLVFWLMDGIPLVVMAIAACAYLWWNILQRQKIWLALLIALSSVSIHWGVLHTLYQGVGFQMWMYALLYSLSGVAILVPLIIWIIRQRSQGWLLASGAVICFAAGITFRSIDTPAVCALLGTGTHFLWHIFAGVSMYLTTWIFYGIRNTTKSQTST